MTIKIGLVPIHLIYKIYTKYLDILFQHELLKCSNFNYKNYNFINFELKTICRLS